MRKVIGVLAALTVSAGAAEAQDGELIAGMATVVDSDGLRVGDTSMML